MASGALPHVLMYQDTNAVSRDYSEGFWPRPWHTVTCSSSLCLCTCFAMWRFHHVRHQKALRAQKDAEQLITLDQALMTSMRKGLKDSTYWSVSTSSLHSRWISAMLREVSCSCVSGSVNSLFSCTSSCNRHNPAS